MLQATKRNLVALGIAGALGGMTTSTATAVPFTFDPSAIDPPAGPINVAPFNFDEITITAIQSAPITIVDQNGNGQLDDGDTFTETGLIAAVNFQLNGANVFNTGIGSAYELLASFDLAGLNAIDASGDVNVDIQSGAASLNVDTNLNNAIGPDQTQVAALSGALGDCQITAGSGLSQGSCVINFDFDSTDDGVFTDVATGEDLQNLATTIRLDINVDQLAPPLDPTFAGGSVDTQTVDSDFDGSARLDAAAVPPPPVPEPGTLALLGLGLGLLGLAGITHHRRAARVSRCLPALA